jgi:hypothetical protein
MSSLPAGYARIPKDENEGYFRSRRFIVFLDENYHNREDVWDADFRGKEKPSAFIRVDPRPNGLVAAVLRCGYLPEYTPKFDFGHTLHL